MNLIANLIALVAGWVLAAFFSDRVSFDLGTVNWADAMVYAHWLAGVVAVCLIPLTGCLLVLAVCGLVWLFAELMKRVAK